RLVGPKSNSACSTRPRLVEPTSEEESRERGLGPAASAVLPPSPAFRAGARPVVNKRSASESIAACFVSVPDDVQPPATASTCRQFLIKSPVIHQTNPR